jgi:hypothetical protein
MCAFTVCLFSYVIAQIILQQTPLDQMMGGSLDTFLDVFYQRRIIGSGTIIDFRFQ